MSDGQEKRFYWLKLKVNFMTSETVDFLMSQKDGANYIVLYQMLCLKTINTDGRLSRQIGKIIIPFDENKIQRDCKWFSIDTIRVAMELYKELGLIYEDTDGTLVIKDHQGLIGSECSSAERVRKLRNSNKQLLEAPKQDDALHCNTECNAQCNTVCNENVTTEIENRDRDKEIDNRDTYLSFSDENDMRESVKKIVAKWNETGVSPVKGMSSKSQRWKMLTARIREYGLESVLEAVENVSQSRFLHGENGRSWMITFDWFVKPGNFLKVLEGQYNDEYGRPQNQATAGHKSGADRLMEKIARGDYDT